MRPTSCASRLTLPLTPPPLLWAQRFLAAIDAVEDNVRARARFGADGAGTLLAFVEAVAFLCNAFAVESLGRGAADDAAALLARAEETTRRPCLRKCKESEAARLGLRAATFNTLAMVHRRAGHTRAALRAVNSAVKASLPLALSHR